MLNAAAFVVFAAGAIPDCGIGIAGQARPRHWRSLSLALLVGAFISLVIEVTQAFIPARDSNMVDLICNTTGTVLGAGFWVLGSRFWGLGNQWCRAKNVERRAFIYHVVSCLYKERISQFHRETGKISGRSC